MGLDGNLYYTVNAPNKLVSIGKVDATADRKASALRVNAIHEGVKFTRTMSKVVQSELEDMASWLGLSDVNVSKKGDLATELRTAVQRR